MVQEGEDDSRKCSKNTVQVQKLTHKSAMAHKKTRIKTVQSAYDLARIPRPAAAFSS